MRLDAVDLVEHPEATPVDGVRTTRFGAHPLERAARDQRSPAATVAPAVLRPSLRPEERHRLAGELGERFLPWPWHGPRRMRGSVKLCRKRLAGLDDSVDGRTVGKRQHESA